MQHTTLMIQGTTSDAGKTTVVAGLCRMLARKGHKVAPFKPQNMALNSAVTEDGGEIGRAQALQALACGIEATRDMNPVLIKPSSDTNAQIIIQGRAREDMDAKSFHQYKKQAMAAVLNSYQTLAKQYDTILAEGAGSPAEINLREGDIANMGFAEEVDCPVILVADIDKGGVFAHLIGTLELLSKSERQRVVGFVINKFRGDISLLQPGLDWLEERTKKPVLGVLPYIPKLYLDAEDAISIAQELDEEQTQLNVVVIVLPRISNHTDFDALRVHPNVNLNYVADIDKLLSCDLIIIPGSKSVISDLEWLKNQGWDIAIKKHLRYGGKVLGICGGLQILGSNVFDPDHIESDIAEAEGLALLPVNTTLMPDKTLDRTSARITSKPNESKFSAYQIRHGISYLTSDLETLFELEGGVKEGFMSEDSQVLGTYLHGIFDQASTLNYLLRWAGLSQEKTDYESKSHDMAKLREVELNRLADVFEECIDMDKLEPALHTFKHVTE